MTRVEIDLPDDTLRDLIDLAIRKNISRTEALAQAVETTKQLYDFAPQGVAIRPLPQVLAALRREE